MSISTNRRIPAFGRDHLEGIARAIGHTEDGLTGSELGDLLAACGIEDDSPGLTKWVRIFNGFINFQNEHRVGNHVLKFIGLAMSPVRYTDKPEVFEGRRVRLNAVLALSGYELGDDGKMRARKAATNLTDALERADRLRSQLRQRNVHGDVLKFCDAEILAKNYFHAVFEAMKSVTAKIRGMTGSNSDGHELIDAAFSFGKSGSPMLALSSLQSETLKGEQRGFVSLLKGLYGTVRNPLAHNAKIEWDMTEQDALDILTTISLVHRKLDKAKQYAETTKTA
jgi:uncharacterized protein (TIGR02391 family)